MRKAAIFVAAFLPLFCAPHWLVAQNAETRQSSDVAAEKVIEDLLQRLETVERELSRLKAHKGDVPAAVEDRDVHVLLETPYLGSTYDRSSSAMRFFVGRLIFVNLTTDAVRVKRDDIELQVNGKTFKLKEIPSRVQYQSFQVGSQTFQLRNLEVAAEVQVPAGGTGATWVIFAGLPPGNDVPRLLLTVDLDAEPLELDINQFTRGLLGLEVERVGPRDTLALLTISGMLDTINVQQLVDELERLSAQKVVRAVVRWADTAGPVDPKLLAWLAQVASQSGRGEVSNNRFPLIPASLRELHLAQIPGEDRGRSRGSSSRFDAGRIHETGVEAVTSALHSAYMVLPRDELLEEIKSGHPLTRAAALAAGGGRLPADKLPLLLEYADDENPLIQQAALVALRHFGEPEAVDKLLAYARKNAEPLAIKAVESLAASRFATAHKALLDIFENEGPESKKRIVEVLARYPRPIWSEPIYQFARDPNSGLGVEALRALARIGHPRLLEVFRRALASGENELTDEAFKLLVSRTDAESEDLALEFTLKHLKQSPPTAPMYELLKRTKDRRAVPLLLAQLRKRSENRSAIINALASIGDESVADVLIEKYPELRNHEKTAALNALGQLRSPAFRRLAGEALLASDSSLVSTAARGLQGDGSPEAIRMLIAALEESSHSATWSYVSNALATLATPAARAALREARNSDNLSKRNYAQNALRNIWQRSPGYQYVYRGQELAERDQLEEALAQFSAALELDNELPDAYAGRANVLLNQGKHDEAKDDYKRALRLDPYNSVAVAGMSIALIMEGKCSAGVEFAEAARPRFRKDRLFAYNAACVYSRAYQHVKQNEDVEGRDEKLARYKQKAINELKQAVKLRFRDFDWMKKDPDLKSLHGLPEFQEIVSQRG